MTNAGLLGIALANEEYSDEAVRSPLVPALCKYLRRAAGSTATYSLLPYPNPRALQGSTTPGSSTAAGTTTDLAAGSTISGGTGSTAAGSGAGAAGDAAAAAAAVADAGDVARIRMVRLIGALRCLMCTGEYVEALGPCLAEQGVDVAFQLLQGGEQDGTFTYEVLQMLCSLLAHRRVAEELVEKGGVQLLLGLPR